MGPVTYFSQLCPDRPGLGPGENAADWIVDLTCKASKQHWVGVRGTYARCQSCAQCHQGRVGVRKRCLRALNLTAPALLCRCCWGIHFLQAEWQGDEDTFAASYAGSDLKHMADAQIQLLLGRSNRDLSKCWVGRGCDRLVPSQSSTSACTCTWQPCACGSAHNFAHGGSQMLAQARRTTTTSR